MRKRIYTWLERKAECKDVRGRKKTSRESMLLKASMACGLALHMVSFCPPWNLSMRIQAPIVLANNPPRIWKQYVPRKNLLSIYYDHKTGYSACSLPGAFLALRTPNKQEDSRKHIFQPEWLSISANWQDHNIQQFRIFSNMTLASSILQLVWFMSCWKIY